MNSPKEAAARRGIVGENVGLVDTIAGIVEDISSVCVDAKN